MSAVGNLNPGCKNLASRKFGITFLKLKLCNVKDQHGFINVDIFIWRFDGMILNNIRKLQNNLNDLIAQMHCCKLKKC